MTEMNNTRELAANIIDIFEDFLASIGKVIPCSDPDTEEERAENDDAAARLPLPDVNRACKDLRVAYNKSRTIDNTSEFPLSFHIPPLKGQALFMRVCPFSFGPSRVSAILYR